MGGEMPRTSLHGSDDNLVSPVDQRDHRGAVWSKCDGLTFIHSLCNLFEHHNCVSVRSLSWNQGGSERRAAVRLSGSSETTLGSGDLD